MVNETGDVSKTVETGSGSGGTTTIDRTTYRFPSQLIYRDGVARAAILAALENTLFDIYSSDAYTAKVLRDKLDQTHNTDSQGLEKYSVARFLDFKLVDGKFMTEQELMPVEHGSSKVNVGQKRKVGHWSKDCPSKKAKKAGMVAQENTVLELGTMSGPVANTVIGEVVASGTDDGLFVPYQQSHGVIVTMGNASAAQVLGIGNDEALDKFIMYKNEAETKTGKVLKRLRSDRGGEYTSTLFNELCASNGIVYEVTTPYTPESNGVAERKNRTFKDMINSMLTNSGFPEYIWGEALNTACHILNRVPLKHMDKTPYELWRKRRKSLSYLRVWGCLAKVLVPEHKRNKLVEFHDTTFFEEVFPMKTGIPLGSSEDDPTHTSSSIPDHVERMSNVGADPGSSSTPNEVEEPRRSKRAKVVKDFGSDFITYNVENEPLTFRQAMDSSESRHWKGAVKSEIDSIVSNGTYDILLFGTNIEIINETNSFLKRNFEMKDMGEASVILGINLTQSIDGITLSQSHYIEKSILEKYSYSNCRIASTPYDSKVALVKNSSGFPVSRLRYSQIIGSLQYLANVTRSDISYSVSNLARYTRCPNKTHWEAPDRVLRYLKGTISLGLHYRRFLGVLEGYSDASWIAKKSGSNRVTGYVFTLAGGAVSCKSSRHTLITRSTFEVELCALDATGTEAEWLHGLMSMLPVVSKQLPAIFVHCDSRPTIENIRSVKYNAKTKRHIQVGLKSIRGLMSDRIIAIEFIGSQVNIDDPPTKGLDHDVVLKSRLGMGLVTRKPDLSNGSGHVTFATRDEADKAIAGMQGRIIRGTHIQVSLIKEEKNLVQSMCAIHQITGENHNVKSGGLHSFTLNEYTNHSPISGSIFTELYARVSMNYD
ncbi:hypothetical protein AgCh_039379 [Apium graveolens]